MVKVFVVGLEAKGLELECCIALVGGENEDV